MKITWVDLRPRLAGHPRRPAVLRLLEQGQDHRGGVRRRAAGGRGSSALAALHRRRHHRVLHVPAVLHDLPRQEALDRGRQHPHESPRADDRADDHAGRRLGRASAWSSAPPARDQPLARRRSSASARRASTRSSRPACSPSLTLRAGRSSASRWPGCGTGASEVPRGRAGRLARSPAPPAGPLPGRRQRGPADAARAAPHPVAGLRRRQGRRRRGRWPGRAGRRLVRPTAPAAERLRPLLRPDDARRRRRRPRCPGGESSDDELPLADRRSAPSRSSARRRGRSPCPRGAGRPGQAGRARLLAGLAGARRRCMALQFKRNSGAQFQFAEVHQWIPQFGVQLRARRRRHRRWC